MFKRCVIFAVGFLIPFAVGELVLRWLDPYHFAEKEDHAQYEAKIFDPETQRLRKGAEATYLGTKTVISSQGWRSPTFLPKKPEGVFRVLLLGGSVPFGWGVNQGNEFPRVLEKMWNRAGLAGDERIEVINAGVPGWRIEHAGMFLKNEGLKYEPDLVLLTLVATDVPTQREGAPRRELFSDEVRRFRLAWAFENRFRFNTPGTQGRRYDAYAKLDAGGLIAVQAILGEFLKVCNRTGSRFVVFDTLGRESIEKRCAEIDVHRINGYTSWELRTSWEVAATDPHPDADGHRHLAEMIFRGMQDPALWR